MGIIDLLQGNISQQDLLYSYNAKIDFIYLPSGINGLVYQWRGCYVIFINKFLSIDKIKKTLLHELAHIELGQLEQNDNDLLAFKCEYYEDEADKYLSNILNEIN